MSEKMSIVDFEPLYIYFVDYVYTQNIQILHGVPISVEERKKCLYDEHDPNEINFIITFDSENSTWISMLVVGVKYQQKDVGSFAVGFVENYARKLHKAAAVLLHEAGILHCK